MNDFALSLLLLGALSSGGQLPFWAGANQFGLMPEGSGGLALLRAGTEYDATKDPQWKWGVSLAGQYDSRCPVEMPGQAGHDDSQAGHDAGAKGTADFSAMVDELYASARCGDEARGYRLSGCRDAGFGLNVDYGWAYRLER